MLLDAHLSGLCDPGGPEGSGCTPSTSEEGVTTHGLPHYEYLIRQTGMLTFISYSSFYG